MNKGKSAVLILVASLAWLPDLHASKVYKIVNPDGSITYTDNPPADHQQTAPLNLPPINTQSSPEVPANLRTSNEDDTPEVYQALEITSPADDATIPPGQQTVTVSASVTPALRPGHQLQLYYDGEPHSVSSSLSVTLNPPLYRGSHSIQFAVVDKNGKILIKSAPHTIHIKRASKPAPTKSTPKPKSGN